MTPVDTDAAALRRRTYTLLIVLAGGVLAGRLFAAERVYEPSLTRPEGVANPIVSVWPRTRPAPMPTFSSNDRSRWATVRALVDEGTYAIGRRDRALVIASGLAPLGAADDLAAAALSTGGFALRTRSDTGILFEDGWQSVDRVLHPETFVFYSSKPPLLPTLLAGEYWVLQRLTGWTLRDDPFAVVRTILVTVNLLPMLLYLGLVARLADRHGATDWGRLYVVAAACFATLLTPFAVSLNNHTIAAVFVLFALYPVLTRWDAAAPPGFGWLALSGLCAGFAACNELPATAFTAALGGALFLRWPGRTLAAYLPAALVPVALLLWTNYLALGEFSPAYGKLDSPWYRYEGSHWRVEPGQVKRGIDFLSESKGLYAFHLLLGHHGLFSLTPIFLLSLLGAVGSMALGKGAVAGGWMPPRPAPRLTAGLTLLLTAVVVGFYVFKTNNYGGWSNGPRWLMWLTPLWLLTLLPVADRLGERRWGRGLAYALLAASVLSVHFYDWNPWRHPWLMRLMQSRGWIDY